MISVKSRHEFEFGSIKLTTFNNNSIVSRPQLTTLVCESDTP